MKLTSASFTDLSAYRRNISMDALLYTTTSPSFPSTRCDLLKRVSELKLFSVFDDFSFLFSFNRSDTRVSIPHLEHLTAQ